MNTLHTYSLPRDVSAKLIAKAWIDCEFKRRLLADPMTAIAELGFDLPPDVTVQAHEETQKIRHLVIPVPPPETDFYEEEISSISPPCETSSPCTTGTQQSAQCGGCATGPCTAGYPG